MSSTWRVYLTPDERVRAAEAAAAAIAKGKSHHGVVSAVIDAINEDRKDYDK